MQSYQGNIVKGQVRPEWYGLRNPRNWIIKESELAIQRYHFISLHVVHTSSVILGMPLTTPIHIYEFSVTAKGLRPSEHYIKSADNTQLEHTNEVNPSHCNVICGTDVLIRKH